MAPHPDHEPAGDRLAPEREEKEAQVMKREGVEEELMDEDESDVGEQLDDVQGDETEGAPHE